MAIEEGDGPAPAGQLTGAETELFGAVIRSLRGRGIPFLLGGGYVFSHYSGLWRDTKDMDVVLAYEHFMPAVELVQAAGMRDYYEVETYDRSWIYRGYQEADGERLIVDVIHRFPNRIDAIDPSWFARGVVARFAGEEVPLVCPEDLIWMKLCVLQRQRCDWPDILNVIRGQSGALDWDHLLQLTGEHWRLLAALVETYDWLCPAERHFIPDPFRAELDRRRALPEPARGTRATFLDRRPWLTKPGAGVPARATDDSGDKMTG